MQGIELKDFQYTIVIPAVDSYVLINAPKGWEDNTEVTYKRSETYYGTVRSLSVPLQFPTEGATILRSQFYRYNAQALAFIQIDKLNKSTWEYELEYYGKLDFTKAIDNDNYFQIPAIDAGIEAKIKAFENVKYELPVDVPEAIDITLSPLILIESADLLVVPSEEDQQPGFTGLSIINNEIKSVNESVQDVQYTTDTNPNFGTSDRWFYKAQVSNTVNIKIKDLLGSVQTFLSGSQRFRLYITKDSGIIPVTLLDVTINNTAQAFNINQEIDIPIAVGERLFLYQRIDGQLGDNTGFNFNGGTISLSYSTQSPATKCKALRPKYVLEQLIKKINGNFSYPVQSLLLDEWAQLTLTSGDAIRQIEGAKIKTSFSDFFKSISAVTCAGHSVENGAVTIEYRPSYFRNVKTLSMLDSKDVEMSTATDLLFNSIKTGYLNQTYDEINGKDEINSQHNYVIDTIGVVRELDTMSVYRADAYGIEFLRINLEGKSSTDNDSDNDVFFVYVNKEAELDGTYKPFIDGTITGVLAGFSYYNWYISPHRNLLRWGAYIHSIFYGNDGYQIRFASGLKNTNVTTVVNGEAVTENSNINISELDPPYFMPMYASFTTRLPENIWQYFNNGVYGYGDIMYKGVVLNGFFIESDIDLSMNSERDFKLLLTLNNNLIELIQ